MTQRANSLARLHWIVWGVPAGMLLVGVLPLPYGYYQFLRLIVCGFSGFLAWKDYSIVGQLNAFSAMFGTISLLMNPIIPVYLSKDVWMVLDFARAGTFVWHRDRVTRIVD
jgi:hypothetical protein